MRRTGQARRGFTLFEVMISLLVLTTAIISTIALLPVGIKAQQLSRSQMFASSAAMTLMNNFHTPVDKFEGISRIGPHFDGIPGVDSASPGSTPFKGWASEIRDELIQASPYQPNLEQQAGWLNGVLPVPTEIARRLDSNNDEIQNLLDDGGVLLYPDPNFMMGLNQGAAMDKTMNVLPAPELQKLVFGVTSLAQQNALPSNPVESLPWYEIYPFPPEWISMQATGRETRRLQMSGANDGQADYFYPNPWMHWTPTWVNEYGPWWFSGNGRGGWPSWPLAPAGSGMWNDQWYGPWGNWKLTGISLSGAASTDWGVCSGILSLCDTGHARYEPVRFGRPMRQGQEQGPSPAGAPAFNGYFPESPIDDPNANDDILNPAVMATVTQGTLTGGNQLPYTTLPTTAASSPYFGNGFSHGRNWRFFAAKIGGLWKDGNGLVALPSYAWKCFQRLSGGDDDYIGTKKRYGSSSVDSYSTDDPLDPNSNAKFHRAGWLPVRALLTNPDFPSYEHLQHMDIWEMVTSVWKPTIWPDGTLWGAAHPSTTGPHPGGNFMSSHPNGLNCPWGTTTDDLTNFTWKSAPPKTINPPATYEMRANYRDRAIDLWQAVMPRNSVPAANIMRKNPSVVALVDVNDGGTMVDCNKYEYPPSELDKFKFISPQALTASDFPIHPAQILALSYLAHAAMMVTGYSPPFSDDVQAHSESGKLDAPKVPWECLNWTYKISALEAAAGIKETSLWATDRNVAPLPGGGNLYATKPAGLPVTPGPVNPNTDLWERPWPYGGSNLDQWSGYPEQIKPKYVQQWPIAQEVTGQGITKDALVVAESVKPGPYPLGDGTFSRIKLRNDTAHGWVVYPGDELVFQISYYQWWYKYGRGTTYLPQNIEARFYNNFWDTADPLNEWDGRYDPDSAPGTPSRRYLWWTDQGSPSKYPNTLYKCQTFHVVAVNGFTEATWPPPPGVSGSTLATVDVDITPPLPRYPRQFNDARAVPGPPTTPPLAAGAFGGDQEAAWRQNLPTAFDATQTYTQSDFDGEGTGYPVVAATASAPASEATPIEGFALHKDTLVRRVANPHDVAFARKVYEMCMQWSAAYAAESPNDCGAPRPANHQTMMDKPLAMFDLFYDAGSSSGDGNAVRSVQNRPTSAGSSPTESFYRWMTPKNLVPNDWFYGGSPPAGNHALSNLGPGRERQDYFEAMAYNAQLQQPGAQSDEKRFWLTKPFSAFHRCRSLTFWSVDWKSYEDAETVPSAPIDFAKHGRYLRKTTAGAYDVIAPYVEFGHSALVGPPESLYMWTDVSRQQRYVDVVGGETAGYLYQNWIGGLGQPRPGTFAGNNYRSPTWWTNYPLTADPPATNGQPVSADVHLGHWGADRNGNGVLDLGPVPRGSRMKAVRVSDFYFYDPVLRLHSGN